MKETILELEARVQKLEAMYSAIQNIALLRLNHIPFTEEQIQTICLYLTEPDCTGYIEELKPKKENEWN